MSNVSLNGVARMRTNIGEFLSRSYDPSLLQVLGVPDVDGKDLYTCLVTDRWDAILGALNTAAAAGAVTDSDLVMAYVKQLVTNSEAIVDDTGTAGVVLGTKAAAFKLLAGEPQVAITTEDLNQVEATYDLFLGTTKPCMLHSLSIKQPTTVTAGALTSISIQTDDATPGVIISSADGAVGNLLTESELVWTGAMRIETGTTIQLTIAGGATGVAQSCKIAVEYVAIEDTGVLVAQE